MRDRAEDLNEWRSEQYAKNAKSYEPKVWLTLNEAILAKKCVRYVAGYLVKAEEARMVWKFADKLSD